MRTAAAAVKFNDPRDITCTKRLGVCSGVHIDVLEG
jgi:hypothetical protein